MTTVTENDLKRLEDLINNRFDGVQRDIKSLDEKIQGIDIKLATVMTKTEGLKERVDDINSHLNIMTIGFLSIVRVLVTGILGIIGKLAFFPNT